MSRYSPINPSDLSAEQKDVHDKLSDLAPKMFGDAFEYKNNQGAFIGPFAPLLSTPDLCKAYFGLVQQIGKIPGLPPTARETVILATGHHYKAAYEIYAHERVAETTDLTTEQIKMINAGRKPEGLDPAASVAFDAAMELVGKPGPLGRKSWDACVAELGRDGTLALIHYVGIYAYTCVLLNGCDVPLPEGEEVF